MQAIWATGTQFWQAPDQPFAFVGANNFNLIDASAYSEASVYNLLVTHWNNGIRVRAALMSCACIPNVAAPRNTCNAGPRLPSSLGPAWGRDKTHVI